MLYEPLEPSSYEVTLSNVSSAVTLADAKQHLSLFDDTTFDDHLETLIVAANEIASQIVGEYFQATTIKASFPRWEQRLALPHKYIDSIESVQYYNSSNTLTDITGYVFDNSGLDKSIKFTGSAPTVSEDYDNPIIVTYVAEVSPDVFQERYAHAILLIVGELFSHDKRENSSKVIYRDVPLAAQRLLGDIRRSL